MAFKFQSCVILQELVPHIKPPSIMFDQCLLGFVPRPNLRSSRLLWKTSCCFATLATSCQCHPQDGVFIYFCTNP
jgi:hypothetical protein